MNLGVSILDKVRVYELAKELNTTSKRLTEKLAEIDIHVKNHMSLLSDEEIEALYNHIGIIKQDKVKKPEAEEKKSPHASNPILNSNPVPNVASADLKNKSKKAAKQAPRIIRKTEIIIDSSSDNVDEKVISSPNTANTNASKAQKDGKSHRSIVRTAEANSGLRAGFVRNTDIEDYISHSLKNSNNVDSDKSDNTKHDNAKHDVKQDNRSNLIQEQKVTSKPVESTSTVKGPTINQNEDKSSDNKKNETKRIEKQSASDGVSSIVEKSNVNEAEKTEVDVQATGNIIQDVKPEEKVVSDQQSVDGVHESKNHDVKANANVDKKQVQPSVNKTDGQQNQNHNKNLKTENKNDNRNVNKQNDKQHQHNKPNDKNVNANKNNDKNATGNKQNDKQNFKQNDNRNNNKQGDRTFNRPNDGNKPFNRPNDRTAAKHGDRLPEIPKADLTAAKTEELTSAKNELKREFSIKDVDRDIRREQRKDGAKPFINKNERFRPNSVKLTEKKGISEVLSEDFILDEFYDSDGFKRTKKAPKPKKDARGSTENKHIPPKAVLTHVKIRESITVKDLAETLKKTATEVIKKLMALGVMATLNHELDFDTAAIVAEEFGITAEKEVEISEEDILFDDAETEDESKLEPRPPVVVVMGHVDHGKTSLLDAIREADVVKGEAGGITQHIGAYSVKINNRNITFLDTPGHEAFTAMRARGAQVTDIAILVVAADDGVMPQTVEAINHAKAANVTIIVAINKIDKPGANPDRVKQELTEYGLVPEEWGGDVICVNVSAKKRENIDGLLEMVLLTADMLELKADPTRQAKGTVIEAKLDKDRGPIATMLVQRGTLKHGDSIVTGTTVGRIRAMVDDKGNHIKKAGPSMPVEILGLPEVPEAGETFYAIKDEKTAKQLAEKRKLKLREEHLKSTAKVTLEDLFSQIKEGKVKELNVIVKADVQGSVEAVKQSLEKLSDEEVRVKIIHGGVGAISEHDVTLAQVSNAIIIGFNVRPGINVAEKAKDVGVDIRLYRIIYNAIEDIKAAMKGMLEPTYKEVVQGHAEIRQLFKVSGIGTIAGCYVTDGKITRNADVRIIRDGIVIHEGKVESLKRFKDDVREVSAGYECGIGISKFNDIKEGDIIECSVMEEVKQ